MSTRGIDDDELIRIIKDCFKITNIQYDKIKSLKTRLLIIVGIIFFSMHMPADAFASCIADVDYDIVLQESDLVFIGTVDRLENYDGPQRVTFIIHEIIKGEIETQKYVLKNMGLIFNNNDTIQSSSISVDYQIGKTFKVYVRNGDTDSCITKEIFITDYLWEPGPESGKYTSKNPVWKDPCPEGYGQSNGVCITLEEMNRNAPDRGDGPAPEPVPPHTSEELDEMCRNGQALCQPPVIHGPLVTTPGNDSDGLILAFFVGGIGISFILGIIYWWKRK